MTTLVLTLLLFANAWALIRAHRLRAENRREARAVNDAAQRACAEIDHMRASLERDAEIYTADFAAKLRALQRFMALWNAGLKEEARDVLSEVGFVEATLQ